MIQLPDINHPFLDENGLVNKDWYDFLNEVVTTINDLESRVTVLEP